MSEQQIVQPGPGEGERVSGQRILAVVPVRAGVLARGGDEAVAEAGGRGLLVGDGVAGAAAGLAGIARELWLWEAGAYQPGTWAAALAGLLATEAVVLLPASADGRHLAPRLAHCLARPLLAGAVAVHAESVVLALAGGQVAREVRRDAPVVVTLQPGVRGVVAGADELPSPRHLKIAAAAVADAEVVEVLEADAATVDLVDATRIVAGGAGLGEPANLALLGAVGERLGASLGATRVLTDAGWLGHERQIGTTGVEVDPELYLAVGISGAVQHLMGIGDPDHVIAVNTDASCPMMRRADLAIVSDGPAVVRELAARLGVPGSEAGTTP